MSEPKPPRPLSLRSYARRRGVSPEAVSKAITDGRLRDSVVMVGGAPKIADAELADREWEANSRPRVAAAIDHTEYYASRSKRETAAAEIAQLELAEKRGELMAVKDYRAQLAIVEASLTTMITQCRHRLLAIPSKLGQRLSDEKRDPEVLRLVDALIREALEELAAGKPDNEGNVEGEGEP